MEEKVLLDWASKVSKKYVSKELSQEIHNRAEPFIKWLREAEEEESDSEEESDDDLEVILQTFLIKSNIYFVMNCRLNMTIEHKEHL